MEHFLQRLNRPSWLLAAFPNSLCGFVFKHIEHSLKASGDGGKYAVEEAVGRDGDKLKQPSIS